MVNLWQSGEEFEKRGGKRERGMLFLGAPGTGKTMLAKAIATNFKCPFVTIPGSGFAATFIGIDVDRRHVPDPQGQAAGQEVGRPVHHLHRRDRRRRPAPPGRRRDGRRRLRRHDRPLDDRPELLRPHGRAEPDRRHDPRDRRVARAAVPRAQARADAGLGRPRQRRRPGLSPRSWAAAGAAWRSTSCSCRWTASTSRPSSAASSPTRLNTWLDAMYFVPQRDRQGVAAAQAAEALARAGLLHRRDQHPADRARPGAHASGPDGPPRVVPHAHAGGPQGHLRPLHGQGRPRCGARHRAPPRRALAHHQRLLAGHDRAGVLDGADLRHLRGAQAVRVDRHRRGHDHGRVGHRDQPALPRAREALDRHPRGRARRRQPHLRRQPPLDPALDPPPRPFGRPPRGDREGGALRPLAQRGVRRPRVGPRRDGGRDRLLRPELHRRGRRRRVRHHAGRGHGRLLAAWGPSPSTSPSASATRSRPRSCRTRPCSTTRRSACGS